MTDTFLLIHSPLVGPYSWIPAQAELQARGQQVIVPSLLEVLSRKSGFGPAITAAVRAELQGQTLSDGLYLILHSAAGAFVTAIRQAVPGEVVEMILAVTERLKPMSRRPGERFNKA